MKKFLIMFGIFILVWIVIIAHNGHITSTFKNIDYKQYIENHRTVNLKDCNVSELFNVPNNVYIIKTKWTVYMPPDCNYNNIITLNSISTSTTDYTEKSIICLNGSGYKYIPLRGQDQINLNYIYIPVQTEKRFLKHDLFYLVTIPIFNNKILYNKADATVVSDSLKTYLIYPKVLYRISHHKIYHAFVSYLYNLYQSINNNSDKQCVANYSPPLDCVTNAKISDSFTNKLDKNYIVLESLVANTYTKYQNYYVFLVSPNRTILAAFKVSIP